MSNLSKTDRITIGANLRHLRKDLGLSQEQLATVVSCASPYIAQLEADTHTPSLRMSIALADALGVSLDELVGRDSLDARIERERRLDILRQIEELKAQL